MILGSKFQAHGNDFLIVPADQLSESDWPDTARALCDRHFGIGADGIVYVRPNPPDEASIRLFNQDGSVAEMSGNGARCAASYLQLKGLFGGSEVCLTTLSGSKRFVLLEAGPPTWSFRAAMGRPRFLPREIPFLEQSPAGTSGLYRMTAAGLETECLPLNVGNPQCVVLVESPLRDSVFRELGRAISSHSCFPDGTNVSFLRVESRSRVHIQIWERGVGPTLSSGTGSCAAAVAAIRRGLADSPLQVVTETGYQTVEWNPGGQIYLSGEAHFIADFMTR